MFITCLTYVSGMYIDLSPFELQMTGVTDLANVSIATSRQPVLPSGKSIGRGKSKRSRSGSKVSVDDEAAVSSRDKGGEHTEDNLDLINEEFGTGEDNISEDEDLIDV